MSERVPGPDAVNGLLPPPDELATRCAGVARRTQSRARPLVLPVLALALALSGACRSAPAPAPRTHELLGATLWLQTSVEYPAGAVQAYRLARVRLEQALADPAWTASSEQLESGGYATLPPAVILDVDETVLDNSPFEARLVLDEEEYDPAGNWPRWVHEAAAAAVPGAVEFTTWAAERGVAVFYVTNRNHDLEEPTRRNLEALGFPLLADRDPLLTRYERPEWQSEKAGRRRHVAETHRILLLIGDDASDFATGFRASLEERRRRLAETAAYWGERWIVVPNPVHGSWERALYDWGDGLSRAEKLEYKYRALQPRR